MLTEVLSSPVIPWLLSQSRKQEDRGKSFKITVKAVISVVILAVIAYFMVKVWWKDRSLAKVRHQRDVKEEEINRLKTRHVLEKDLEKAAELEKEIEDLQKEESLLKSRLTGIREKRDVEKKKLEAVKNWEDLDNYLDHLDANIPYKSSSEPRETP